MFDLIVSNATGKNYNLPLRVKLENGTSYLKPVRIPAYALNHTVRFANESEANEWKKVHIDYTNEKSGIIKIGKASGHSLEKQNKDIEKEEAKAFENDQAKMKDKDEEVGAEVDVEKVGEPTKKKK